MSAAATTPSIARPFRAIAGAMVMVVHLARVPLAMSAPRHAAVKHLL
jgi:hypothetical protein